MTSALKSLLDNLASAIIHSAAFPQYPIRGVEQNIRFEPLELAKYSFERVRRLTLEHVGPNRSDG